MPLYPCLAVLIGLVVERCQQAPLGAAWTTPWKRCFRLLSLLMPVAGVAVLAASLSSRGPLQGTQSATMLAVYLAVAVALGAWSLYCAHRNLLSHYAISTFCVAAFLGLTYTGVIVNVLSVRQQPIAAEVARLKDRLPAGVRLVSIGQVDPNFAFYYGEPIRQLSWEDPEALRGGDWTYFCLGFGAFRPKCEFAYEDVAKICCDPTVSEHPTHVVIVGCRKRADLSLH